MENGAGRSARRGSSPGGKVSRCSSVSDPARRRRVSSSRRPVALRQRRVARRGGSPAERSGPKPRLEQRPGSPQQHMPLQREVEGTRGREYSGPGHARGGAGRRSRRRYRSDVANERGSRADGAPIGGRPPAMPSPRSKWRARRASRPRRRGDRGGRPGGSSSRDEDLHRLVVTAEKWIREQRSALVRRQRRDRVRIVPGSLAFPKLSVRHRVNDGFLGGAGVAHGR